MSEDDIFDNRLIFGDNLLALKALEQEFAGKVKCVFIDPPYNTGSAFEHYDDGVEHSIWLSLMRDRLEIFCRLLLERWLAVDHASTTTRRTTSRSCATRCSVEPTSSPTSFGRSGYVARRIAHGISLDVTITCLVYAKDVEAVNEDTQSLR